MAAEEKWSEEQPIPFLFLGSILTSLGFLQTEIAEDSEDFLLLRDLCLCNHSIVCDYRPKCINIAISGLQRGLVVNALAAVRILLLAVIFQFLNNFNLVKFANALKTKKEDQIY